MSCTCQDGEYCPVLAHHGECGVAYDHAWRPGDTECCDCGADLSEEDTQ